MIPAMKVAVLLKAWRNREELSIREASDILGISRATYYRIEQGHAMDGDTLAHLLCWLLTE